MNRRVRENDVSSKGVKVSYDLRVLQSYSLRDCLKRRANLFPFYDVAEVEKLCFSRRKGNNRVAAIGNDEENFFLNFYRGRRK